MKSGLLTVTGDAPLPSAVPILGSTSPLEPTDDPVGVAVLGSTGSVGSQTLDVISSMADAFRVVSLAAGHDSAAFRQQIERFRPKLAALYEPPNRNFSAGCVMMSGPEGLKAAATHPDVSIVVVATSGHAAIEPTLAAVEAGKTIAIANKETIVCAGKLVVDRAIARGVQIRPVDSEHSALWQALIGARRQDIAALHLTASGGPFRHLSAKELRSVKAADALEHPTWRMGEKITIDSATMMNKGLEVLEAQTLFGVGLDQIQVVVHPQSIVHSLVGFADGSQIAQLSLPDMRLPIQFALTYPDHRSSPCRPLSLAEIGALTFEAPDEDRFPALRIARSAGALGGTYPTVLSAADEVAVTAFLKDQISFPEILEVVEGALSTHQEPGELSIETIFDADRSARDRAARRVKVLRR